MSSRARSSFLLCGIVALIAAINLIAHLTGRWTGLFAVPLGALVVAAVAYAAGLRAPDLGLARAELRAGIPYALGAAVAVFAIVSIAVAVPATRQFFLSDRFNSATEALLAAFVLIPLQTVLPEELIFRGVLQGTAQRVFGVRVTLAVCAGLFGLWHIASSTGLTAGNAGLREVIGSGAVATAVGIGGAVLATSAAGFVLSWLRYRTTSLLAPIALHWALNATGALGAAVAWHLPG